MSNFSGQLWIAGIVLGAVVTFGATRVGAQEAPEGHLTMLVYDYSELDSGTLLGAEKEASRIFSRSGVTIT